MTRYLPLLLLGLGASSAMAKLLSPPVPAPSRSQSPTLPKTIKVPAVSSTSSGGAPASQQQEQQQTPSAATVEAPSTMEAKTPKLPTDEGKAPPPAELPPENDPKPSATNEATATASPTFLLNDDAADFEEPSETLLQSTAAPVLSTLSPVDYTSATDRLSNSPTAAQSSSSTYPPTVSSDSLFVPSPTVIPTAAVVLSTNVQVSPTHVQTTSDNDNNNGMNDTHSSVYLADESAHYATTVADEINTSETDAQIMQTNSLLEYALISISTGFILSSVAMLGVIRRRATRRKKCEEFSTTVGDGSVL